MRGLEEVQLNWWEQNLHHLPQSPAPHVALQSSQQVGNLGLSTWPNTFPKDVHAVMV